MSKKNQGDSWSLLANELGLEGDVEERESVSVDETSQPVAPMPIVPMSEVPMPEVPMPEVPVRREETPAAPVECVASEPGGFGEGILDELDPLSSPQASQPKEGKKTFFGRFPKINLFGSPAKETPTDAGKGTGSFTSKKLEKVPGAQGRSPRSEKPPVEEPKPTPEIVEQKPVVESIARSLDPWSQIASQVGALTTKGTEEAVETDSKREERSGRRESVRRDERQERPRGRKNKPSMFETERPSESDESLALKKLIDDDPGLVDEAAKRLDSIFSDGDEEFGSRRRSESRSGESRDEQREYRRGRRDQRRDEPKREEPEKKTESRDAAPKRDVRPDDRRESSAETPREERGRGRRGSRYAEREETPVSVREEVIDDHGYGESTWDIEDESKPVERSPRSGRRRGRRDAQRDSQDVERPRAAEESRDSDGRDDDSAGVDFMELNKSVPSWDDAIGAIVDANIARHGQRPSEPRRGRR